MKMIVQFLMGFLVIALCTSVMVGAGGLAIYAVCSMVWELILVWRHETVGVWQAVWFFLVWPSIAWVSALVSIVAGVFVLGIAAKVIDETRSEYIKKRREKKKRSLPSGRDIEA